MGLATQLALALLFAAASSVYPIASFSPRKSCHAPVTPTLLSCDTMLVMVANMTSGVIPRDELNNIVLSYVNSESALVPLSEWATSALVVLRALELAARSYENRESLNRLMHDQVSPALAFTPASMEAGRGAGHTVLAVSDLLAYGVVVDPGTSSDNMVFGACVRFTTGEQDREAVEVARKRGSVAQAELDRRAGDGARAWSARKPFWVGGERW